MTSRDDAEKGSQAGTSPALESQIADLRRDMARLEKRIAESAPREAGLAPAPPAPPAPTGTTPAAAPPAASAGASPSASSSGGATTAAPSTRAAGAPAPRASGRSEASVAEVAGWRADVLQTREPARREAGLAAIDGAIRGGDADVAVPALRTIYDIRDVDYDKRRFREAVIARLGDPSPGVRSAAAWAFLQVAREDGDVERLLEAESTHPEPSHAPLIVSGWISKNRVEGPLADAFVKALATDD